MGGTIDVSDGIGTNQMSGKDTFHFSHPPPLKRAAIAQLCSTASKYYDLQNIAKCANIAKQQHGASMLFLPEYFGFVGIETLN
jgi:hypothetical protein